MATSVEYIQACLPTNIHNREVNVLYASAAKVLP